MKRPLHASAPTLILLVGISLVAAASTGCLSTRSMLADMAITPPNPIQQTERYRSLNPHQQDFLYMSETVREAHPEPYGAWSKAEFDREQERLLALLGADTSSSTFERSIASFLSRMHDSHTTAQVSWLGGEEQYPVSFFWIKDTLILAAVGRQADTTLLGSRVVSFNGIPTDEVFRRFQRFATFENLTRARRVVQFYFVFPTFQREAGIIPADTLLSDTLALELIPLDGNAVTLHVAPARMVKRITSYASHPVTKKINRPFTYQILEQDKTCYMQFNAMVDLRLARVLSFPLNILAYPVAWYMGIGYFENFLEDMCEEMKEKGVTRLIVDLRGNGGGGSIYGEQLLYHLEVPTIPRDYSMAIRFSPLYRAYAAESYRYYATRYEKKYDGRKLPDSLLVVGEFAADDTLAGPYFRNVTDKESDYFIPPDRTVFKGHVYFLVAEPTYSSAIILASLVKDNGLFAMVGQPTGGRPSHYGEAPFLKLPNSHIIFRISCKKFFRPDTTKDGEGSLFPDVEIWPTFQDMKYGRDPVFDWALREGKK